MTESAYFYLKRRFSLASVGGLLYNADRTRYLKENPKGVSEMCKVIEDMRKEEREAGMKEGMKEGIKEGIKEGMKAAARRMLETGKYAFEEIAVISGLSLDEIKQLQAGRSA